MGDLPRPAPPHDLTIPDEGSNTARGVLSLALRYLLRDLRELRDVPAASIEVRRGYRALREVLANLGTTHPGAIPSLLRRPTVSAPLRCLRDGRGEPDALLVELTAQALFELSLSRALPHEVRLSRLPRRLIGLSRRVVVEIPEGTREGSFSDGAVSLDGSPAVLQTSDLLPGITDTTVLALVDNNPLAMEEAHPDKQGNAVDPGGREIAEWIGSLRDARARIARHMPALASEIDLTVQQIVPVGYDPEQHLSASYREAIGTVYMTLHPQPMTMTEALIHEHSHNKLNALAEVDPLLHNAFEPLFSSPVRPDPRPLFGVLLAVHAFLPVARLYQLMVEAGDPEASRPDFARRLSEVVRKSREGAAVLLSNAEPTDVGAGVLEEIRKWDAHFTTT